MGQTLDMRYVVVVVFSENPVVRDDLASRYCPHLVVRSRDELRGVRCSLVVVDAETADDPENLAAAHFAARVGARPRVLVEQRTAALADVSGLR